jgi:hypothetical protein
VTRRKPLTTAELNAFLDSRGIEKTPENRKKYRGEAMAEANVVPKKLAPEEVVSRVKGLPEGTKERVAFEELGHGYTREEFREFFLTGRGLNTAKGE